MFDFLSSQLARGKKKKKKKRRLRVSNGCAKRCKKGEQASARGGGTGENAFH